MQASSLCNALLPPTNYLGSPESVYPSRNGAGRAQHPSHNKTDARKAPVEASEDAAPQTRRCRRRPVARQPPMRNRPAPAATPAAVPPQTTTTPVPEPRPAPRDTPCPGAA
ncbi:hypothetical protein COLSTE_02060, partial [Collinsella stercoris DSM 13279]